MLDSPPWHHATPPWHDLPNAECYKDDEESPDSATCGTSTDKWVTSGERGRNGCASASSVVLRGLPFNVTEEEVLAFVEKAGVSCDVLAPENIVVLLANAQGRPSGFAEIRLARGVDFSDVRVRLHMQHLRGRYIEALPPRPTRKSGAKPNAKFGGARRA